MTAAAGERAPLVELFHSVQGEGRFVGVPMAFVRVATCPLRCDYCDTVHSYAAPPRVPVGDPAAGRFEPNPVAAERAADLVLELAAADGAAARPIASVTGGEPLVVPGFVRALGRALAARTARLHLETAAIDAAALARCVDAVDHVSADYKLPSTIGGRDLGAEHLACCEVAVGARRSLDVKIVLTATAGDDEFAAACARLAPLRDHLLLVLQPVTPCLRATAPLPADALLRHRRTAMAHGFDVRVLPQVHKQLQVP